MQGECKLGAGASENHFGVPKFGTSVVLKISGFCTLCQILMYICGVQNPEIYGRVSPKCMTHDEEHIPLLRGTFRALTLERLKFVESRATDENFG